MPLRAPTPTSAPAPAHTPVPAPSRRLALAVLCGGTLMIILDGSIVTVALPSIQRDLGFSTADLTWTVNAYMIAFGGLLLLAGRLGDLLGRKRVFIAGLALFTAASLLCGVSTSRQMLITARFVQGVGGAAVSAVSLGMIVTLFPEPRERGKAVGAFAFVGAAGASIGQVLGGTLTQALDWHWIFFINLPIGVAAAALAARVLESERGPGLGAKADVLGALLVTSGLMIGVYTIVQTGTGRYGWGSVHTVALAALAAVLLAGFVLRQAKAVSPLLPLRMFRSRNASGAHLVQILMISGMFGFQVLIAQYLQNVVGYGAARTGLAMLPAAVMIAAVSLGLSARLAARFGERRVLLAGLALLVVALGLLTALPVHAGYAAHLLPTMVLIGGGGLALSATITLGMSGSSPRDAGVASGLFNTTQQIGGALGVAVLTTLSSAHARALRADGHDTASALTGGFHLAFGVATGLLAAASFLRQPKAPASGPEPFVGAVEAAADAQLAGTSASCCSAQA